MSEHLAKAADQPRTPQLAAALALSVVAAFVSNTAAGQGGGVVPRPQQLLASPRVINRPLADGRNTQPGYITIDPGGCADTLRLADVHGTVSPTSDLVRLAHSPWFALIAGLASILGLLVPLYRTQIRGLPFSLYRSLVWRRMLLLSFGIGIVLGAAVAFAVQLPPGTSLVTALATAARDNVLPEGVEPLALPIIVGSAAILGAIVYNPVVRVRRAAVREHEALTGTKTAELAALVRGRAHEQLTHSERDRYSDLLQYYAELESRLLEMLLGPAGTLSYRRRWLTATHETADEQPR